MEKYSKNEEKSGEYYVALNAYKQGKSYIRDLEEEKKKLLQ